MLKHQRSLIVDFAAWIAIAFAVFVILPILAKETLCDLPSQQQRPIQSDSGTNQGKEPPNQTAVAQEKNTEKHSDDAKSSYLKYWKRSGFCEETKITDLALVFFTSSLVIVGWFTIRSNELNAKDTERAYIFGTPQIDTKQTQNIGNIFIEVMLQNYGRTVGTIKIIYGEVSLNVQPFGKPVYKNGSARTANGALGPTAGIPVRAPVTFECPVTSDFYFFGYIDYDDIFRRPHTSRFCARIFLDGRGIEAVGSHAFHDWN
jgi:hypothetical protein